MAVLGLGALALLWLATPLREWLDVAQLVVVLNRFGEAPWAPLLLLAAYLVGGLVLFPVNVLIAVTVLVFGPLLGGFYAVLGSLASALLLYEIGRGLRKGVLRRYLTPRLRLLGARLARRGLPAIVFVRIVPIAPYSVVNLVAGAARIRRRGLCARQRARHVARHRRQRLVRRSHRRVDPAPAVVDPVCVRIGARAGSGAAVRAATARRPANAKRRTGMSATTVIASYNTHGGVGVDRRYAPQRIAGVLAELGADIVALQELQAYDAGLDMPRLAGRGDRLSRHRRADPALGRWSLRQRFAQPLSGRFDAAHRAGGRTAGAARRDRRDHRLRRHRAARDRDASGARTRRAPCADRAAARGDSQRSGVADRAARRSQRMVAVRSCAAQPCARTSTKCRRAQRFRPCCRCWRWIASGWRRRIGCGACARIAAGLRASLRIIFRCWPRLTGSPSMPTLPLDIAGTQQSPLRRWPVVLACAALLLLGACSSLRSGYVKRPSVALTPPAAAPNVHYAESRVASHGDQSGFRLLADNNDALMSRVTLADHATHSIDLQYYIFDNDATGRLMMQRLLAAADRGARVRLLVDDLDVGRCRAAVRCDGRTPEHRGASVQSFQHAQSLATVEGRAVPARLPPPQPAHAQQGLHRRQRRGDRRRAQHRRCLFQQWRQHALPRPRRDRDRSGRHRSLARVRCVLERRGGHSGDRVRDDPSDAGSTGAAARAAGQVRACVGALGLRSGVDRLAAGRGRRAARPVGCGAMR